VKFRAAYLDIVRRVIREKAEVLADAFRLLKKVHSAVDDIAVKIERAVHIDYEIFYFVKNGIFTHRFLSLRTVLILPFWAIIVNKFTVDLTADL